MNPVDICNMSLTMLNIPNIISFDDASNQAKSCRKFYPELRDRILRDHTWSFATASFQLPKLAEESCDANFQFACALPNDCIRVISLDREDAPYRRIGQKICVNALPASVIYIRRVEDCNLFDPLFTEALEYLIAAQLAMANTRDAQLSNLYRQSYLECLQAARSVDSQENVHVYQRKRYSSFIAARMRG